MNDAEKRDLADWFRRSIILRLRMSFETPRRITDETGAELWLKDWTRAILGTCTDRAILEDAWVRVIKTHKGREWPNAAIYCEKIREISADRKEHQPTDHRQARIAAPKDRTDREVDQLMRLIAGTFDGQRAITEGWGLMIQDDLRERKIHGPQDLTTDYLARLQRNAIAFERALELADRRAQENPGLMTAVYSLGLAIDKRAQILRETYCKV